MLFVNLYTPAAVSGIKLAEALGARVLNDISRSECTPNDIVINWGAGNDFWGANRFAKVLNRPACIARAVNKIHAFKEVEQHAPTVPWTTNKAIAKAWLLGGHKVCARTVIEGSDGRGLVLVDPHLPYPGEDITQRLPDAILYTQFIPRTEEYRITVCRDKTVGVQLKVPIEGKEHNHEIRTTSGGYGFHYLEDHETPHGLRPVAKAAAKALGLDFAGIDLLRDRATGAVYFLEANTAPLLTPIIKTRLATAIRELLNENRPGS